MVRPSAKRAVVCYLRDKYSISISLACQLVKLSRSLHYKLPSKDDSQTEEKLLELAKEYSTRGFDWYYLKIRQEGLKWNRKRVLRIYRKLNLGLRRKHKKRVNRAYQECLAHPIAPNYTWSMDFMSDALEDGRKVRVFNIMDDYNREALAVEAGLSFPSSRVIRVLEQLAFERGLPDQIRVDNGPEFASHEMKLFAEKYGLELLFIPPGKPNKNGYIERFNRTYREDVLDAYIFENLSQLQLISDQWKSKYNHGHPHQSLKGMSPVAFKNARHKIIEAYEEVKAKINGSLTSPALTSSSPSSINRCEHFERKS